MRPRCSWGTKRHGILVTVVWSGLGIAAAAQAPPPDPKPASSTKRTDELSKRLLRRAMKHADEDVMEQILRLMGESAKRIEIESDPGKKTQEVQQQIVQKLDEAIASAAKNQRKQRQQDPSPATDKRRRSKAQPDATQDGTEPAGQPVTDAGARPGDQAGQSNAEEQPGGEFADIRRAWGHLPPREREELIQGSGEEHLERYRIWVERYYRALQEAGSAEPK